MIKQQLRFLVRGECIESDPSNQDTSINRRLLSQMCTIQPLKLGHLTNQDTSFCPRVHYISYCKFTIIHYLAYVKFTNLYIKFTILYMLNLLTCIF